MMWYSVIVHLTKKLQQRYAYQSDNSGDKIDNANHVDSTVTIQHIDGVVMRLYSAIQILSFGHRSRKNDSVEDQRVKEYHKRYQAVTIRLLNQIVSHEGRMLVTTMKKDTDNANKTLINRLIIQRNNLREYDRKKLQERSWIQSWFG